MCVFEMSLSQICSKGRHFFRGLSWDFGAGEVPGVLGQKSTQGVMFLGNDSMILLMAEILHHLGCMKPYK